MEIYCLVSAVILCDVDSSLTLGFFDFCFYLPSLFVTIFKSPLVWSISAICASEFLLSIRVIQLQRQTRHRVLLLMLIR